MYCDGYTSNVTSYFTPFSNNPIDFKSQVTFPVAGSKVAAGGAGSSSDVHSTPFL